MDICLNLAIEKAIGPDYLPPFLFSKCDKNNLSFIISIILQN